MRKCRRIARSIWHSAHCWGRTSLAQLRAAVQLALWWLTIVGGVIKTFSYYLCSFILAENPTMKGKDAIALSRKMMNGHKWECFLMELSFVPCICCRWRRSA